MKIVHVVRQFAPSVGGLENVVMHLAREQQRRLGHDVRVVTLDRLFSEPSVRLAASEVVDGIPVRRLAWGGSSRYPLCPQVVRHLGDADLVHVHAIDFFFDWLSATRLIHRKPLIASTHGGFFHTAFASTLKKFWFLTITRRSAAGYRRLIATSDNDGAVFASISPRVTVIENGAEIDRYRGAASQEVVPVILYFGRWSSNKGIPALISLLAALRRRGKPAWRLVIAGRPYDLDAAAIASLIDAAGVATDVDVHEAPSDDQLRSLMTRATYFGCLSRYEGFGIAAIEAMSAGLVPILSDIPPFRKIADDSGCGALLSLDTAVDAQAAQVVALHEATTETPDMRDRCEGFARRYDWATVADRFDAVYRDTLGRGFGVPILRS